MVGARDLIKRLALQPHPEGGWYRETWRAPAGDNGRPASTAILFLLETSQRSHWHKVDADEIWLWQGGDTLKLMQSASSDTVPEPILLGPAELADCHLQAVVPAGHWQAAKPVPDGRHGYVLIGCVVSPGFDFSGFELAPEGWQPGRKD